ncbi:Protein kinase [Sorochytrium milnesiophthora]
MANIRSQIGNYEIIDTLGSGSFGKVKLAQHTLTGHRVAMKFINKKKVAQSGVDMLARVEREIQVLLFLRHPHIIKLYEVISTPSDIVMVMEYAGGELFDLISERGRVSENDARRFFQQIISAIAYCHSHNIVHRDLKPENLLLSQPMFSTAGTVPASSSSSSGKSSAGHNPLSSDGVNVKVADFGLSNTLTDGDFLKTSCGSPNYAAPEVISGKLYAGPEVDVWSCGVILYVMLCGRLPFDDEYIPNLFRKINEGIFTIPSYLSTDAKQLLMAMLVVDPLKRITIADIQKHPWYAQNLPTYLAPRPPFPHRNGQAAQRKPSADFSDAPAAGANGHSSHQHNGCDDDIDDAAIVEELSKKLGLTVTDILRYLQDDVDDDPSRPDQPDRSVVFTNTSTAVPSPLLPGAESTRPSRNWQNDVRVAYDLLADSRRLWGQYTATGSRAFAGAVKPAPAQNGSHQQQTKASANTPPGVFGTMASAARSLPGEGTVKVLSRSNEQQQQQQQQQPLLQADASPSLLASSSLSHRSSASSLQQIKSFKTRSKWHVGIRSRSHPLEVMQEIFKALKQIRMEWKVITPFHLHCRYAYAAHESLNHSTVVKMDIQLYKVDSNYYLVDFKFLPPKPSFSSTPAAATAASAVSPDLPKPSPTLSASASKANSNTPPKSALTAALSSQKASIPPSPASSPLLTPTIHVSSTPSGSAHPLSQSHSNASLLSTSLSAASANSSNTTVTTASLSTSLQSSVVGSFVPVRRRTSSAHKLVGRTSSPTLPASASTASASVPSSSQISPSAPTSPVAASQSLSDSAGKDKVVNVFAFMEVCTRLISELACG